MKKPRKIRIGLVQQACSEDYQHNLDTTATGIRELAQQGVQLVCLQELHAYPYPCQIETRDHYQQAETIPGPTTDYFSQLAKQYKIVIVVSLFEQRTTGLYHNTAVVLDSDGSIAGKYRKMHIPDDPGFYEKYYFTPGDLGFTPIQTSIGKLGVLVCWDQWFPEAARLMALAGADLLLYPTAIGWDPMADKMTQQQELDAWITIQRAHSIANMLPVVVCNRTGFEKNPDNAQTGIQFWGNSFITNAMGTIITKATADKSCTLIAEIDYSQTEQYRQTWPHLRDRRIDAYANLLSRFID